MNHRERDEIAFTTDRLATLRQQACGEVFELLVTAEWVFGLRDAPKWVAKNVAPLFEKGGKYEELNGRRIAQWVHNEMCDSSVYEAMTEVLPIHKGDDQSFYTPIYVRAIYSPEMEELSSSDSTSEARDKLAAKYGL